MTRLLMSPVHDHPISLVVTRLTNGKTTDKLLQELGNGGAKSEAVLQLNPCGAVRVVNK